MKELIILIRPEKLEDVKKILDDINCGGMTLSTVMGCGTQKGISSDAEETVNEINNTYSCCKNIFTYCEL